MSDAALHPRPHSDGKNRLADLVARFSKALLEKLIASEEKYHWEEGWRQFDWSDDLRDNIRRHVDKGDPRDVAAYCAFAWHHGWSLAYPLAPCPHSSATCEPYRLQGMRCQECPENAPPEAADDLVERLRSWNDCAFEPDGIPLDAADLREVRQQLRAAADTITALTAEVERQDKVTHGINEAYWEREREAMDLRERVAKLGMR